MWRQKSKKKKEDDSTRTLRYTHAENEGGASQSRNHLVPRDGCCLFTGNQGYTQDIEKEKEQVNIKIKTDMIYSRKAGVDQPFFFLSLAIDIYAFRIGIFCFVL